jgi:hypothetical protein
MLLGAGYDPRSAGAFSLTWIFAEPRVLVWPTPGAHRHFEVELTGRIGQANSSTRTIDPSLLACGVLIAYHLNDRPGVRGVRVGLQYQRGRLGNIGNYTGTSFSSLTTSLTWLP